ncbi:MAG TPA: histidine kinase [Thermoanaerobaculia bacterium]|jgi:signal transduction histidine kinase
MSAEEHRADHLPHLVAALVLVFATLTYAIHLMLFHRLHGGDPSWGEELAESAVHWVAWVLVLPLALSVIRSVKLRANAVSLLIHGGAAVGITLAQIALRAVLDQTLIHHEWALPVIVDGFVATFSRTFFGGLITYSAAVIAREALLRQRHQREEAAVRDRQLAVAQLAVLQNQLQPHFLFNALNGISSLMHDDVAAANRMLLHLSNLLRALLEENGSPEITLDRELELLDDFVQVEKARLAERFRFELAIDPGTRRAMLPRLLLQPLVENAVRHAVSSRRDGGRVVVSVSAAGDRLRLEVGDDGPGLPPDHSESGIGIRNCRSRLEQLYGPDQSFRVRNRAGGGVIATIAIPLRYAEAAA